MTPGSLRSAALHPESTGVLDPKRWLGNGRRPANRDGIVVCRLSLFSPSFCPIFVCFFQLASLAGGQYLVPWVLYVRLSVHTKTRRSCCCSSPRFVVDERTDRRPDACLPASLPPLMTWFPGTLARCFLRLPLTNRAGPLTPQRSTHESTPCACPGCQGGGGVESRESSRG